MKLFDTISDYVQLGRSKKRLRDAKKFCVTVKNLVDGRANTDDIAPYLPIISEAEEKLNKAKNSYETLQRIIKGGN